MNEARAIRITGTCFLSVWVLSSGNTLQIILVIRSVFMRSKIKEEKLHLNPFTAGPSLLGGLGLLIQPNLTSDAFAGLYISSLMRNISGKICTNGQIECLCFFAYFVLN